MPTTAPNPPRRRSPHVSGSRLLLIFGVLALVSGVALYWALWPLYVRGKDGLRVKPDPTARRPE